MPALKDHGLEFVDPFEKMKMRDKSLKDMGSENFDLSALPPAHTFACIWVVLKMFPDVILLDVEGSPILQIKDVKHAAAAREASSRAEAYCSCSLTLSRLAPADHVLRYIKEHEANAAELLRHIQIVYTPLGMPGLVMAAGMDTVGTFPPPLLADIQRVQQDMGGLQGLKAAEQQLAELSNNCSSFLDRCHSELQQECAPVPPPPWPTVDPSFQAGK